MDIFKPLQVSVNRQVLEQDNRFHCIVSATLGVRLSSAESLLEFDFSREAFEHMGDSPLPDIGMPKPRGEYLVSGSFYSLEKQMVPGGEVIVRLGNHEKRLFVFGDREWVMGIPSQPEPVTSVPISWSNAYGGNGYAFNPNGIGFNDNLLPNVEDPQHLLTSDKQQIHPAGLFPMDPSWPQRMQYQGTYDESYVEKYFPGYPADHDWRFFMTAPDDQWQEDFFIGKESFELHNLHPEKPLIRGRLPGYLVRCFLNQQVDGGRKFHELKLNLDTVWFFPETDLALLIWRKGIDVADDEAGEITDILLAYESSSDSPRPIDHYQAALEKRLRSDDALLNNFNTSDLIPIGAKCAMELLQESALADTKDSPFSDNMNAKASTVSKLVNEKMKEVKEQINEQVNTNVEMPDNIPQDEKEKIKQQLNLDEWLNKTKEAKPDKDAEAMNQKLEAILPGITAGDPRKISLKEFSFSKIDEIFAVTDEYMNGKQAQAKAELDKIKGSLEEQPTDFMDSLEGLPEEEKNRLKEQMDGLLDHEIPDEPPMPRMNLNELEEAMSELSPQITESMQQLDELKAMGGDDGSIKDMEKMISEILEQQEAGVSDRMEEVASSVKDLYIMGAHHQPQCRSPHKEDHVVVTEKLITHIRKKQAVSNGDWACLDLSDKVLDGTDFSGAYLEQVDFTNASLKGCNFEGAILARAVLSNADCSGAKFDYANLGAVTAHSTDFTSAHFTETILWKSDFSHARFLSAVLDEVQAMEIIIGGTDFTQCNLEGFRFIKLKLKDTIFKEAKLGGSIFVDCDIIGCDFTGATMPNSVWTNSSLVNTAFDRADLTSNSFSAKEEEPVSIANLSFVECNLEKANFQKLAMPGSNFRNANLQNANFGESEVRQADFSYSNAKQALFRKAVLTHSNFDHADIMEGIMTKAYLSGASFKHANLYAVDFLRSTMGETDFTGANLDNTIIQDWQPS